MESPPEIVTEPSDSSLCKSTASSCQYDDITTQHNIIQIYNENQGSIEKAIANKHQYFR
jgi:hypothetical protein